LPIDKNCLAIHHLQERASGQKRAGTIVKQRIN